jgi:hypothetical protein
MTGKEKNDLLIKVARWSCFLNFIGTESETKEFMQVCVKTVKKYPGDDYRSPVFIFERLCSIIFPVSKQYMYSQT